MKRKSIILLVLIVLILSIPTIYANDNESLADNLSLGESQDLSFDELNSNITNTKEGQILTLNNNYTFKSDTQYVDGIVIDKAITIDGAGHTIDANSSARIFTISASGVVLKNLIFKNGNSTNGYGGGAIFINSNANNVVIDNSTFINNAHSNYGGAIWWQGDEGVLTSSKFTGNNANRGGAVYWFNDYGLINNTSFEFNVANSDGGAVFWNTLGFSTSNFQIFNSNFTKNHAFLDAGAVYCGGVYALINQSWFINNTAFQNGGAILVMNSNGKITLSKFMNNSALNGGAVYIHSPASNCQISSSLFVNNQFDSGNTILWQASGGKIIDSILISPDSNYIIQTSGNANNLIADYNWWGNTNENYQTNNKINGAALNNWLFLNITKSSDVSINDSVDLEIKINNLYNQTSIKEYINNNLPSISVSLKAVNGTLSDDDILLNKGEATLSFSPKNTSSIVKANYYNVESNITIKTKLKINFNVTISDVEYPNKAIAIVKSDVDGEYILNVNNRNYSVNVVGGEDSITLDILAADKYNASILFKGNDTYLSSKNTTSFNVNRADNTLTILIDDTQYLKNATATINGVDGKYTLEVNSKLYNATVSGGSSVIVLDILPVAKYEAILKFLNNNYTNTENKTMFNVTRISNTLNVTINDCQYPNNATALVMASVDGEYQLKVNQKTYTFNVINSQATVYLDVLNVGDDYLVNLTFNNDNYINHSNYTTFSIYKGNNALSVEVEDVNYPNSPIAQVRASVDGVYSLKVNGITYNVTVKNNTGNITLNKLYVGNYNVTLIFNNTNYTINENRSSFNVNKGINTLNVSINDTEFGKNPLAVVSASVDGNYTLEVNSVVYDVTVSGGVGSVSINSLAIGEYTAILKFSDNNYTKLENKTTFNVVKIKNTLKVVIENTEYLKNPIAYINASVDGKYTLKVNGETYNFTVNKNIANVTLKPLYVGQYLANLTFINENVTNHENSTIFNITKSSNSLNITIVDVIYPSNPIAIVKASVDGVYTVNVNGTDYIVNVVGGEGNTKIKVLNANTYIAKVIFNNENYTNLENKTTFKVSGSNNTLSVEIADVAYKSNATAYVKASADGEYILEVNGTNYTVNVVNSTGNVTIKSLQRGSYNATLIFEDENYANHKNTTTFNVVKANYTVSIDVLNVYYPNLAVVNVKASVDGEYILKINSKTYKVNVINGNASQILDLLGANKYSIDITYSDGENYTEFTNTTTFNVLKGNNTLSITIPNVDFVTPATAYVTASVDGNYSVDVNGRTYDLVVKNNKGNVTFDRFNLGVYEAVLIFNNKNYTNVQNYTSFKTAQYFNKLSMEIDNVTYLENVTIFITVNIQGAYNLEVDGKTYSINIERNTANITIPNLPAGNYTAVLTLIDSDYFTSPTNTTDFTVYKYDNKLNVSFSDVIYPENVTAFVIADIDGVYALCVDGVGYTVNLVNGTGNITLNVLNAGRYNATLKFPDSQNYTNSQNTTIFEIAKIKNQIKLTVEDVDYGENATVYITASQKGNYTLTVNGRKYAVININNTGNYTLTNLAGGDYIVNITYEDVINYETPMNSTSFNVAKIPNNLSVTIDNVTYPDKIIAFVSGSVDGQYYLNINNVKYPLEVVNGKGNISLQIPAGTYTAEISYFDTQNYTNPTNTTKFGVTKGSVKFNVSVDDVAYMDDVVVKINSNTDGYYVVSIIGTSYLQNAEVKNGTANVVFDTLPFGEYEVYVMFLSNNNYNIVDNSTTFNVIRANVTMNVTFEDNCHGKDLIIKAKSQANANYTVEIDGGKYDLNIVNGEGSVSVSNLKIGNYTLLVKGSESQYYNAYEKSYNLTITKAINYDFGVITPVAVYGGNAIVTITLPGDATGYISINGTYNTSIDGSCIIEIPNLAIGNHSIEIEYSGDYNYTAITKSAVITVISSIIANNTTRVYNSDYDFKMSLLNSDNGPLANTKVVLTIDNINITVSSDEHGNITLSQLAIGNHTIIIHNPDTNESAKYNLNIISRFSGNKDIMMSYYSGTKYRVYVYDDNGKAASGVKVQFIINGKSRSIKTTNAGLASITIKELPGAYTIIASYNGQSISNTVVVKQNLKAYKKTLTVKKTAKKLTVKATLKRYTGKAIKGKQITFKFKGKKYYATTNSKGIAKITIKKSVINKLKAGKKYTITYTYVKNTVKGYIKVKK